jgi:hypothetical protein
LTYRVDSNDALIRALTVTGPIVAFARAVTEACGIGARQAMSASGQNNLAKDVSTPTFHGPFSATAGSDLPYANTEQFGAGVEGQPYITPVRSEFLYIHGPRVGAAGQSTRSTFGGPIVARKKSVWHPAKHYLDPIAPSFVALFLEHFRSMA